MWPGGRTTPRLTPLQTALMTDALGALFAFFFKYRPPRLPRGGPGVPALLSYGGVRGKSTRRDRVVLVALRIAALLVLVVLLFRPKLLLSSAVPHRHYVGVLLADSRRMQIAARSGRARADFVRDSILAPRSALLDALQEKFQVRLFRFGATADRMEGGTRLAFNANETRRGD